MLREIELPRNEEMDTLSHPGRVSGFICPAEDYAQRRLHIAHRIVDDPTNTFYFESDDDQMRYFSIRKGSILVVDRSVEIKPGMIVVCSVDGEWLTRKYCVKDSGHYLCINDSFDACLNITGKDVVLFGAVTWHCYPHINNNVRVSRL